MTCKELYEKHHCNSCDEYTYVFKVTTSNEEYTLYLCKKCVLELLKAIVER